MMTDTFEQLSPEQLVIPHGGISDSARWVMMHEFGGSTTAGHLHAQGRGDGTPGNHSSAFGAFQMIEATRRRYMGADYQSTSFAKQPPNWTGPTTVSKVVWKSMRPGGCTATGRAPSEEPLSANVVIQIASGPAPPTRRIVAYRERRRLA